MYEIFGRREEEGPLSKAGLVAQAMHPDDRASFEAAIAEGLEAGRSVHVVFRIRRNDGEWRWLEVTGRFEHTPEGEPLRLVAVVGDVTERKQAEEAVRRALDESGRRRAETKALLDAARAVLEKPGFPEAARAIFDRCKNLIGATAGYVALLSKDGSENEVVFLDAGGQPCTVAPDLPMPIRGLRGEGYRTGRVVYDNDFANSKWVEFMPPGHTRLDSVLFAPMALGGEVIGLLGLGNKSGGFTENDARLASAFGDLAAIALRSSRALELLEGSEQRFRSIVETASDAIISADSRSHIVFWNRAAEAIFGYSAAEIMGQPLDLIMPERFRQAHHRGMERLASTGQTSISGKVVEMVALRKDGGEFPAELAVVGWKTGEERFFTGIVRDITERKRVEQALQKTAADLARSNEDLKQFAYVASHDLQEPLRTITGYLQLIERRYHSQLDADAGEFIHFAVDGAARMQQLINSLLAYSRVSSQVQPFAPTNCNQVLERVLAGLRSVIAETNTEVTRDPLPTVLADAGQMDQLFQNLIGNALKFRGPAPPRIHVTARAAQGQWQFSVSDTGIGIESQYHGRIFEVFERLHGQGEYPGTGIGLSICKRIVEGHGGRIWVESQPGRGTTFHFTIPGEQL